MESVVRILKAISDESRLRILNLIVSADEICVCDIESTLGFSQTKVSRHLTILKNAGLVNDRRQGLWMLYKLSETQFEAYKNLLVGLKEVFSSSPIFQEDLLRLAKAVKNGSCKTFSVIQPNRTPRIIQTQ